MTTETQTTEMIVTRIELTLDPQSLVGDGTSFEVEGLDEWASQERYEELLTNALRAEYPEASILVWLRPASAQMMIETTPDWTQSDMDTAYAFAEGQLTQVQRIYETIFESGAWAVEAR